MSEMSERVFERARKKEEKKRQRETKRTMRQLRWSNAYEAVWTKAEKLSPPGTNIESLRTVYPIGLILSQIALFLDFVSEWNDAERYIEVYQVAGVFYATGELPGFLYLLTSVLQWPMFFLMILSACKGVESCPAAVPI